MAILNLQNYLYVGGAALLAGALVAGLIAWNVQDNKIENLKLTHENQLLAQQVIAESASKELANYKLDFVTRLGDRKDELQSDYEENVAAINASVGKLAGIRLSDPRGSNSGGAGSTGNSPGTGGGNGSSASGGALLSEETSQDLLRLIAEADQMTERMRTCQTWNETIRTEFDTYRSNIDKLRRDLEKQGVEVKKE